MVSQKEKEDFERFKDQLNQSKSIEEENRKKSNYFMQKTDEIFGSGFKGFEFAVGEKKMLYAPGSAEELKVAQSSPLNFIGKFLDKDGLMQDANGYHRALAIAMNPEKFAKHFYEQGLADATEGTMKEIKNISMSEQKNPELIKKGGMQVKALNPDSGKSLKIQSRKKLK
jgi:rubrerythrin